MRRSLLVFEDILTTPRRRLFTLSGVDVMATPFAWLSLPFFCALGVLVALARRSEGTLELQWLIGLEYGLLLYLTNVIHSLGHLIAGKMVGAPMDVLLLTATRDVTLYLKDQSQYSRWIFIGRSSGGPMTNLLVGTVGLGLQSMFSGGWLTIFAYINLAIGIWTLCPVPTMDGWVIWGELFGFRPHA